MRFPHHERAVVQCLQPCSRRLSVLPARQCISRRRYASQPDASPQQDVAVLGGGITGLATAHWLAKAGHKVTVFEASSRLGGWIQSKYVDVPGGQVLFEQGPRSLRPSLPNGWITWKLIDEMGFATEQKIVGASKTSPGARSRFIYYPDHLVKLPGGAGMSLWSNIKTIWSEPLFAPMWNISLGNLMAKREGYQDESVGDFVTRRLNAGVANNVVSAVAHGIYAGDIWKLSAESIMPALWRLDSDDSPGEFSVQWKKQDAAILKEMVSAEPTPALQGFDFLAKQSSFYTFKAGLQDFSDGLAKQLEENPNIKIQSSHKVEAVRFDKASNKVTVRSASTNDSTAEPPKFDQVISTLPHSTFNTLATDTASTSGYKSSWAPHSTTVNVVNLYWSGDKSLLPVQGFGYLIPQSIPFEQNPELGLGVIFDSLAFPGFQDTVQGTKVTVILGGHYWDGWDSYPDEQESIAMARLLLARHLGITAEPTTTHFSHQRNCIPQYYVGHRSKLAGVHSQLLNAFDGRVKVAGASYTGVGVNDCVRAAWDVAKSVSDPETRQLTGLQDSVGKQEWEKFHLALERRTKSFRVDKINLELEKQRDQLKEKLRKQAEERKRG